MYGFPEAHELEVLVGQHLVEVASTANQIILEFSEKASIVCEKGFRLLDKTGNACEVGIPLDQMSIMRLLQEEIRAVLENGKEGLIIKFSNGYSVVLIDDDEYESFRIDVAGRQFVV
jgi:hypothetical protein